MGGRRAARAGGTPRTRWMNLGGGARGGVPMPAELSAEDGEKKTEA